MGSASVATRIATLVGQGMAYILILAGIGGLLLGDVFVGIWIAFLGWFVLEGAQFADRALLLGTALEGRCRKDLLHFVDVRRTLGLEMEGKAS